ncbi:MAG: 16S rRNA (guanine(527)-N(7))-methyltransferase RsmG [Cyclobacteriaceae bacterium]
MKSTGSLAIIEKYFSSLSQNQLQQFAQLNELYASWNEKINVISRKDIDHLYERHVLHSLGIAKVCAFKSDTRILDVGTGGGFPGIPLAILFPEAHFHLVDSIGKKILVVNEVAKALGLKNLTASHSRAENLPEKYDFVVSRAVTKLEPFCQWVKGKFNTISKNTIPNGILYLKGGDLELELKEVRQSLLVYDLQDYFEEPFFETKKVVYVQMSA